MIKFGIGPEDQKATLQEQMDHLETDRIASMQNRESWVKYAAAALTGLFAEKTGDDQANRGEYGTRSMAEVAAEFADDMLQEERKRR